MIRPATIEDVDQMLILGAQMHAESKFSQYSFDPWKLRETICTLIEDGIVLVAEFDGEIVGGFIGFITSHYFGHDKVSYDLALFIHPKHRGGTAAVRLIRRYISEAKERGVSEICIANSTGVDKDRVANLFMRLGFKHDGYVLSMNSKDVA